jgi:hypothetical protein
MLEKRRVRRTRVLRGVKIILDDSSSLLDCSVRDLTNIGACVYLPSSVKISNSFALSFDFGHSCRRCSVIWRHENKLGVSFY